MTEEDNKKIVAVVNIESPIPIGYCDTIEKGSIYDNERQIKYIQPLIDSGRVFYSTAYTWNYDAYLKNEPPVIRPGRKYMFWFMDQEEAEKFAKEFEGEISPYTEKA